MTPLENIFTLSELSIHLPTVDSPFEAASTVESGRTWVEQALASRERDRCFYDERLVYVVQLSLALQTLSFDGQLNVKRFAEMVRQLQVTSSCHAISQTPPASGSRTTFDRTPSPRVTGLGAAPTPMPPGFLDSQSSAKLSVGSSSIVPPTTPTPFPETKPKDSVYAESEGVLMWEGSPVTSDTGDGETPLIIEENGSFSAYWVGVAPITYVNTKVPDPLLAVTVNLTQRVGRAEGLFSPMQAESVSMMSTAGDEGDEKRVTMGTLGDDDLLGGLGGISLPRSRAPVGFGAAPNNNSLVESPITTLSYGSPSVPAQLEAARKSFRGVLPLSSAIHVRMRTLPAAALHLEDDNEDIQKARKILCVEMELGDGAEVDFEVEKVEVKGGSSCTVAALVEDTLQERIVRPLEVHEILFTAQALSRGGVDPRVHQGPSVITIAVTGKPRVPLEDGSDEYCTATFTSTWNCTVDLRASGPLRSAQTVGRDDTAQRSAGLKTFSRQVSGLQTPLGYPNQHGEFLPSNEEIIVSAKLLDSEKGQDPLPQPGEDLRPIQTFVPFWIEVTVLNSTNRVQRLTLRIPDKAPGKVGEMPQGRWGQQSDSKGVFPLSDIALHNALKKHKTAAPALVALENDHKLAPLQPRTCSTARLRMMAVRTGLHLLENLEVVGIDGSGKSNLRSVLHVLVE